MSRWTPASCWPDDCFCEQVHPGLLAQPANTVSSITFVVVGVWLVWRAWRRDFAAQPHRRHS